MKPETARWVTLYHEDRHMAETAPRDGVYRQCVHHSQQMIEKLLKAHWVESGSERLPPKEHRLLVLATELGLEFDDEEQEFLYELTAQYLPTRYADVMLDYSQETAESYYRRAVEICEQLLTKLS